MTEQVNKAEQNVIKNELLLTWEKVSFLFGTIELTIITLNLIVDLLTLICWNNKKLNTISCELLILLTRIYFLHLRTSQSECFLYLYWPKLLSNNPLIQSLLNARNSSKLFSCGKSWISFDRTCIKNYMIHLESNPSCTPLFGG